MTFDDMYDLASRLRYKPDWSFVVARDASDEIYLRVRFFALSTVTRKSTSYAGRKWRLSEHMTESELVLTAFKACLTAEEHECREWFQLDGEPVCSPHLDMIELARLMATHQLGYDERD